MSRYGGAEPFGVVASGDEGSQDRVDRGDDLGFERDGASSEAQIPLFQLAQEQIDDLAPLTARSRRTRRSPPYPADRAVGSIDSYTSAMPAWIAAALPDGDG